MSTLLQPQNTARVRALANDLRLKLPRELRDMVYSYVCDSPTVKAIPFAYLLEPCHRVHGCRGPSCECKHLPATTPAIVNKGIVGEQVAAEAFEWILRNSYDITIGGPAQFVKFFTDDVLGGGVKPKDYPLRRLTTVITTPKNPIPSAADFKFALTPLMMGAFHLDFTLDVRIHHTNEATVGAEIFVALVPLLKLAMDRLRSKNTRVYVTFEHVNLESWIIDPMIGQGRDTVYVLRMFLQHVNRVSR